MANAKLEHAYTAAHIQALTLLEDLHESVEDLPAPGSEAAPLNWEHVGSLQHLCEQLRELKEHFGKNFRA
ncbi:hypothetical protein [Aporhodopirellula aestuarii]|uniref:Uncharacterized protein n=1 Tax=Aporhodopirellula aestuarii TaxID=2950107 RepID=A0ABT0U2A3_9BACT|nr:hypothetical protein [Aporhodopirellula aestuarii]MCM2370690.1 hypothetical protein [Aporhodopirellula aestuarii]